jgi:hypothetical protein
VSLSECIVGLVKEGRIAPGNAKRADALYDRHYRQLAQSMSPMAAAAEATERAIKSLDADLARRKMLALATIEAQTRVEADMRSFAGGAASDGPIDPRAGPALLDKDSRATYSSVEGRRKTIIGEAQSGLDSIMADHSANLLGQLRNPIQLADMVGELFGRSSGNPDAAAAARAWTQAAERLRQRFNAAGGDIGKIEHWGLPQTHDWRKVREAGFDAWRAETLPRLDRAKMIDRTTGQPFDDDALDAALRKTFDRIRSQGMVDVTPGSGSREMLADARGESRFLIFASADDWAAYADRFGRGNAYDAMMGHIETMARDIALMEILGPNPQATLRFVKDRMIQSAATDAAPGSTAIAAAKSSAKKIDDLYGEISGAWSEPRGETLALTFSSLRALQVAAKLGGGYLSSTSDFAFQYFTRKFNGLPGAGMIGDYVKLMKPGSIEDQKLAVRLGLIAEEWSSRTAAQNRYAAGDISGEIPRRLAEGVLRLSLLSRHTQTQRWVFGMEMLSTFTGQAGKSFDALEPALAGALERYGIDAAGWDKLRKAPMVTDRGAEWLTPRNAGDPALADKFMEMILTETDFAVPVADLSTRAIMNSKLERGTWIGEIGRSALLFKSFGISVLLRHGKRTLEIGGSNGARYAGSLIIGTTLMGGMALMLKDIAAGRDPRDAADAPFYDEETGEFSASPGFWGAAALQGGGFGIFGDFIKSQESRIGGGIAQTLAGPFAQSIDNLILKPYTASDGRGAATFIKGVRGELPGQSLWYTRLAFDRLIADQMMEEIDPQYRASWQRMEQRAEEQGTEFWWRPGEAEPDRAPDFANAFGDSQQEGAYP